MWTFDGTIPQPGHWLVLWIYNIQIGSSFTPGWAQVSDWYFQITYRFYLRFVCALIQVEYISSIESPSDGLTFIPLRHSDRSNEFPALLYPHFAYFQMEFLKKEQRWVRLLVMLSLCLIAWIVWSAQWNWWTRVRIQCHSGFLSDLDCSRGLLSARFN